MECHLLLDVQHDSSRLNREICTRKQDILDPRVKDMLTAAVDSRVFALYAANALLRAKWT